MGQKVNIAITGNDAGFVQAVDHAKEALTAGVAEMKAQLESLQGSLEAATTGMAAFAALLAGGAAFGEIIKSVVNLNVESMEMGKQFGISATQASVLRAALNATHVSAEQFSAAGTKIIRTLNTNEGAFKALGVATRDASGNLRPLADIMLDTNTALLTFQEGTSRGLEATKIYGRGWQEIAPVLRLTKAAMAEAQVTTEELGLAVTKESEAMTGDYRDAMVRVQETLEGIENVIGQAVMPVLTELGNWFRSVGPDVIGGFRIALEGLGVIFRSVAGSVKALWSALTELLSFMGTNFAETIGGEPITALDAFIGVLKAVEVAFISLRTGVEVVVQFVRGKFQEWETYTDAWANVMGRLLRLDWKGVKQAWADGNVAIEAQQQANMAKLVAITEKGAADMLSAISATMGQQAKGTPTDAPPGGKDSSGGADQFGKRLDAWEKELSLEYAALEKQHAAEMEVYKQQEAEFSKAAGARIAIAEQEVEAEMRTYGKGSPQYEKAQEHLVEIKRKANDELLQMADAFNKVETDRQLRAISDQEKNLEEQLQRHEITNAQFEAADILLEDKRTKIAEAGIRARMALIDPTKDPVLYAQLCAQIEALEQQHDEKITQIKKQAAQRDKLQFDQLYKGIQSDFTKSISSMLEGTTTFSQGIKSLFKNITSSIIQFLTQWAVDWAATQIKNLVASKTTAVTSISTLAGVAGASGVASAAAAPYPLDLLAPAVGAEMYAAALAYGAASAEGGYDVPRNLNPLTNLHGGEMVLPKGLADRVRAVTPDTGGSGGGGGRGGMSISVTAMDSRGVVKSLQRRGALAKALRKIYKRTSR